MIVGLEKTFSFYERKLVFKVWQNDLLQGPSDRRNMYGHIKGVTFFKLKFMR